MTARSITTPSVWLVQSVAPAPSWRTLAPLPFREDLAAMARVIRADAGPDAQGMHIVDGVDQLTGQHVVHVQSQADVPDVMRPNTTYVIRASVQWSAEWAEGAELRA